MWKLGHMDYKRWCDLECWLYTLTVAAGAEGVDMWQLVFGKERWNWTSKDMSTMGGEFRVWRGFAEGLSQGRSSLYPHCPPKYILGWSVLEMWAVKGHCNIQEASGFRMGIFLNSWKASASSFSNNHDQRSSIPQHLVSYCHFYCRYILHCDFLKKSFTELFGWQVFMTAVLMSGGSLSYTFPCRTEMLRKCTNCDQ